MLLGLGFSHFARRYYGNRSFFLFLRVLRCFSSPGSLVCTIYSCKRDWPPTSRVSPFGYQGIYACLRLPLAFRSLPRPSSALGALASTLCSSSLDYVDPETRYIYFRLLSNLFLCNWSFKTFSRLSSLCSCQGAWVISHPPLPILSFGSGLSLPFGILKTIQMIERQFFLRTLFRALPLSQLSFVRFDCLFYASFPPRNRPRFETSAFASVCSLERR